MDISRIKDNNQFWIHYLSLEKELQEISEHVFIHERNLKVFSFKIMQLYFAVCTDIDSIFKHIQKNIEVAKPKGNKKNFTIDDHIQMLNDKFPLVRNTIVELKFSGQVLKFNPFEHLFVNLSGNLLLKPFLKDKKSYKFVKYDKCDHYNILYKYPLNKHPLKKNTWWNDYNSVKHSRLDSFHKANLNNLLHSLSALHILNLVYQVSLRQEWIEDYDFIAIEAPALYHYPFFQLRNAFCNKYTSVPYNFCVSNLNNRNIRNAKAWQYQSKGN